MTIHCPLLRLFTVLRRCVLVLVFPFPADCCKEEEEGAGLPPLQQQVDLATCPARGHQSTLNISQLQFSCQLLVVKEQVFFLLIVGVLYCVSSASRIGAINMKLNWCVAVLPALVWLASADSMIVFENPGAANETANGTVAYSDPYRERVGHLIERALGEFSLHMEAAVTAQDPGQNVVFSPLSIATVLAIVLLGARGVTHAEVAKLLGVSAGINLTGKSNAVHEGLGRLLDNLEDHDRTSNGTYIRIAKGLYLQENFKINQTFVNKTIDIYKSEVNQVDFEKNPRDALDVINKWVENRTEGHIKDLLTQEPDFTTKAVIVSALYFTGEWECPFIPNATKLKPFHIGKQGGKTYNEVVDVNLMVNGAEIPYYVDPVRKCTIIGMPYKGKRLSMYVIVPEGDVKTFLDNNSASDLEQLVKKTEIKLVIFLFPRMHLESTVDMVAPLRQMGLKSLFDAHTANLSSIAEGIFVNDAVHKVEIDITEMGTTASAATAFTFNRDGSTPVVRVDKPFIFFIRHDETGVILFWGTVIRPMPHFKRSP